MTAADPIFHPYYGWQAVERGLSWRKLRLYYGESHRRPSLALWRLLVAPFAALYGFTVFSLAGRGLSTYALVVGSTLIAYWCIRPFPTSLLRCWQATTIVNSLPRGQVSGNTGDVRDLRTSPTLVVDDRIAITASVLDVDRLVSPIRIYARRPPAGVRWLGVYHRIGATGEEAIVHHVGSILSAAERMDTPVEHLLATHELHELAHWALEEENNAVHADHAEQWNRVLAAEVSYVTGERSPLWLLPDTDSKEERGKEIEVRRTKNQGWRG